MIDINKMRRLALDGDLAAMQEIILRLEAAESECLEQARLNGMGGEREAALMAKLEAAEKDIAIKEEVIDSLATVIKRLDAQCDAAERERDECNRRRLEAADHFAAQTELMKKKCDALRAKITEMEKQEPVAWLHETRQPLGQRPTILWKPRLFIDGNQWCALFGENIQEGVAGFGDSPDEAMWAFDTAWRKKLSPLPGAQPAPSVPREAINKMLTQLMDLAVSNGANSISMPDEYVEVAAWLCGIPAQPAPSVPDADELAHFIRRIDGAHDLGASALAEKIVDWLAATPETKP